MLNAYEGQHLFHYLRHVSPIRIAGVVELELAGVTEVIRRKAGQLLTRGYSVANTRDREAHPEVVIADMIGSMCSTPFTIGYIGKSQFCVYLPAAQARECRDVLIGTKELASMLRNQDVRLEENDGFLGQSSLRMRMWGHRDKDDKAAHMRDQFGPLRNVLVGYLARDPRRVEARRMLERGETIRVTFQQRGKSK